ncbi:endonuclease/exonuclease/phosphatase family protein [Microbacterium resistens]|uniref:Endonuclease/exonuclease/phosphatase family protein n=1 Tax=Microbacterium resistens TaxID=156977 RepID=A0ABY3RMN6_9MICO|nr:endonuclease/exonuclease/phosphatase family protein [Microbacterium resistens]UGS25113.1 endonuclease/exonuclease/phosphatase family protein [Microbacterium resistens]
MTQTLPAAVHAPPPPPRARPVRRGRALAAASVLLAVWVLLGMLPGQVGALVAATLPWVGAAIAVAVVLTALLARRAVLVPLAAGVVWSLAMIPALPALPGSGTGALTVASQNVQANSGGVAASARTLMDTGAQIVTLTELDGESGAVADELLGQRFAYSYRIGTVGVWSAYPLVDTEPLDLGLGWNRALRVVADTPAGPLSVYLIHAASLRPGEQHARDTMLSALSDEIAADDADRVLAVGDFNATPTDPALGPLRASADWVRPTEAGLGLTWPAAFPLARIDQVFERGLSVVSSTVVRAGASDHLATLTTVDF